MCAALACALGLGASSGYAQTMLLRTENFNVDPNWDGHNNRPATAQAPPAPRFVSQNFGFSSATSHAGGTIGEMGGTITPTGELAYYAKSLPLLDFNTPFTASGRVKVDGGGNTLLGFFNSNVATHNEWRTPNSVALRLYGRGSYFDSNAEYGTSKWRVAAGAIGNGSFSTATSHAWSLSYDPNGAGGLGLITATLGAQSGSFSLVSGHKADGATFDRFGFLTIMKSHDSPGSFWVDNLVVNGATTTFSSDPAFVGVGNRTSFTTENVRFRFNFGYSPTNHAGGAAAGEMGGDFFRGDSRSSATMAYYGDELDQTLTLNQPLHAHGKVTFKRGVTDSTVHIGFFHSTESVRVSEAQATSTPENFVGATIEGPSEEGFFFYPSYNTDEEGSGSGGNRGDITPPRIYPDDMTHDWSLDYDPMAAGGLGRITIALDGQEGYMTLRPGDRANIGAIFDRFGVITPHIDGNGQTVFFDDLTYSIGYIPGAPSWNVNASGNWHDPANWIGDLPDGIGAQALLGGVITSPRTVFSDSGITLGLLRFDSIHTYVIGGNGSLTMQVDSGSAMIDVVKGTHKINLPTHFASNTTLSVASGATLKLSDPVFINAGVVLSQSGAGSVMYESTVTVLGGASLRMNGATEAAAIVLDGNSTAQMAPRGAAPARVLHVGSLSVAATASLDLTDNAAAIGDLSSADVRQMIRDGQITSSLSDPQRRLGYADNAVLGLTELHGQSVDPGSTLVAFTYAGDSNLDGRVDVADLGALASHWQSSAEWIGGDFDYSGLVDVADLGLLAGNWQLSELSLQQALGALGLPSVSVPEPATALACAAIALGCRRRRRP
jgi:hypothetical protein